MDVIAEPVRRYERRVRGFSRNAKLYLTGTVFRSVTHALSSLLLNLYLTSLGFEAAFIGLNSTLLSLSSMLAALPAGLIGDRIGRKRAMVIGLSGMTLAYYGMSLSSIGWLIAACNVLYGVVGALFLTSIAPFLTENSKDEDRSTLFTLNSSLMNLVAFFVMVVGGYLPLFYAKLLDVGPESTTSYRAAMLTAAGAMTLGLIPVLAMRERHIPRAQRTKSRFVPHLWRHFSNPGLMIKLLIPRALTAFGAGLVFPFLNLFFKQAFDVSDATLGWIFGITSLIAAIMMLVGGGVADRLGKIQTTFISRAISTPLLLVIGFAPSLALAVAAHWTRSGFMRLGEPLYMAFAMEQLSARERATGSSLLMMSWDIGWSAGPLVSGIVQVQHGFDPLFVGTVVFYALSLVCMYLFFMRPKRDGA
jgi:MFS family permease